MTLEEILNYRRSVRVYDENQPIDSEVVKKCIELSTLAPSSSNMQLWEFYHVTDKDKVAKFEKICFGQRAARTAQEIVVIVTRLDLHRKRGKAVLEAEIANINKNSPEERKAKRIKDRQTYYGKVLPFLYSRFFGVMGFIRKVVVYSSGLFRPVFYQVSESDLRVGAHKSVALASQTFMLTMAEAGYDTCPMEGFDSRLAKKLLGLPYSAEINMIMSCGIRKGNEGIYGDRIRVPFEEVYTRV